MGLAIVTGAAGFIAWRWCGGWWPKASRCAPWCYPTIHSSRRSVLSHRRRRSRSSPPTSPTTRPSHRRSRAPRASSHTAALVHAWAPYERFDAVNVGGTQNVARAVLAHGVGRLVHVSTSDVFGLADRDHVLDEGSPLRPWHEPYADTKIVAERLLWQRHRDDALPLTVIHPGWVYGPGDRAFFPALAAAITDGSMTFWCRNLRLAWVYIDNLVDACMLASSAPHAVGAGYLVYDTLEGPTLQDVCARIAARIGARPPTRQVPYALALLGRPRARARVAHGGRPHRPAASHRRRQSLRTAVALHQRQGPARARLVAAGRH